MKFIRSYVLVISMICLLTEGFAQDTVVDGIVAVVGGNVILKSEIENQYLQYRSQGVITGSPAHVKCYILETLLFSKLLLHQAEVDSITVTDTQVESEMDRRLRFFISQAGSPDKLEEYYQKTILEIKDELRGIVKEQMMIEQEQQKITAKVSVTPSEVKAFYRKLHKDSIPLVSAEVEIGVIVRQPQIGETEKEATKQRLKDFKERIAQGDDFATLAILYSEDPGSAKQGGELGMFQRGDMRPAFEAAVFKLKPGEISDIVETEDGYHLIQMIERRGDFVNVRHILLQPKVSPIELNQAKLFLDSVADLIKEGKMTFDEAVSKFSDDPSKNNGGLMINQSTGNSKFETGELDPKVFFVIDKLRVGDISKPIRWEERGKELYRIYYLKSRSVPHTAALETDYDRIQELATEQKKMKTIEDWILQKKESSFIQIMDPYKQCDFQRDWIKN